MSDINLDTDIAVVGMAGRFAGASNLSQFWNNLRDGVESLTRFTESQLLAAGVDPADLADPNYVPVGAEMPDMECFDGKFFGFSPREASIMDPQHRHFLEVSWEALENAGHVPETFKGSIGVFGGSGHNAYMPYNLMSNPQLMRQVGFFSVRHTGNDKDFLTTRVSYLLNLKGPSINVQTACSTSLVAIHLGVQSLLNRECDMALAGGVTIEMPHRHGYIYRESEILSPDGHCHAFDANSKGTVFGSGAGVVVLRRLEDAIADGDYIHAIVKGSAINNDGALKVGYMAPSVDGQAQAIAEALAIADVGADTISYIEAHGTGTPVGDPIEISALTQAFRQTTDRVGFCGIGSVKSNIGHTDTAAGVANFLKVALALQHRQLPPSLFFESNNPACDFERSPFYVNHTLKPWTPPVGVPRRAGVSSLGVGGTNAHMVLQEAPTRPASGPSRHHQLIVQSAKSLSALDAGSAALAEHFKTQPQTNLADAAYTLRVGRQAMKQRRIVVAHDGLDAATALAERDAARVFTDVAGADPRSVAFLFAGGGAQHPNMGRDLYDNEPVFRAVVDECLAIVQSKLNVGLRDALFPPQGQEAQAAKQLERPSLALPALLTIQVAQARLLMSWGVQPTAMLGHSMGEYTAAHLAGVFTLDEALTLVELRGRLFESLPEGAMLSVPMAEADVRALMTPELSVSVINAPKMTVVGGPVAAIEALQRKLAELEIDAARVRINVAAHSAMLEPILVPFGEFVKRIPLKPPQWPIVSNLSGTWMTSDEAVDPNYWVRHLRHTVRFADGLQTLLEDPTRVLLEVSPGRTLSSLARQHPARKPQQAVLNSMRHADEQVHDQAHALTTLGRLWTVGVDVPWDKLQGSEKRMRVQLPSYQFDHPRHWVEPGRGSIELAPLERSLHKRKDLAQWFYQPTWTMSPVAASVGECAPKTNTLVFADGHGVADALVATLRKRGDEVVVVRHGKLFKRDNPLAYTVNPTSHADMDRLVASMTAEGRVPSRIVHAWSVSGDESVKRTAAAATIQRQLGFDSLLLMAQAAGREDWSEPIKLLVLSDHLQRVASERQVMPAKAMLLGPVHVIPREFSNIRSASLDVETPKSGSRAAALLTHAIVAELDGPLADALLAWRGGQRWSQSYTPSPLPDAKSPGVVWRERGTYVITGGLGGVGLAIASHLATHVRARLVLVGRTALPVRSEWARLLANPSDNAAVVQRVRQVMAMEHQGAEVLVVAADVTDVLQLRTALKQARQRFGDIHGLLHTAGVLDDGVMQLKEMAAVSSVLAPKVDGTLALEAALTDVQPGQPLDFMVLFSSISAFAGLAGQVDYAAANAFLDAYAQDRYMRDGTYTVSVNWSQWQEVGMAAALAHQLGLDAVPTLDAQSFDVGHPLIQRRLVHGTDESLFETRFSRATHWLLDEHRIRDGEALIPGTGYLEIARTALAQHFVLEASDAIELRDVTFLSPFVVPEGASRDLRVHLRAHGTDAFAFAISGREVAVGSPPSTEGDAAGSWTEHARGTVARVRGTAHAGNLVNVAIKTKAPALVAANCSVRHQLGAKTPSNLYFGPRWDNVVRIHFGHREALIELALADAFIADLAQFPLHPAMMDLATAGAQSLMVGYDEAKDFFVPASYDRVTVHAPLSNHVFSHVRLRDDEGNGPDLAVYDVTVVDAQGKVLVDIEAFTMIRVRDKALLSGGDAGRKASAVPQPTNKPRATANNVLAMGMRDGILSKEGAEVLERVLAWGAGPQIVVSPQDLHAMLAQLQGPNVPTVEPSDVALEAAPGTRAPTTATEKLIAQLWGEMLGHARVSASDNFFDLGGHSLLAVQVINKLRKRTGKALALTALLEAPTVEELAALISPNETVESSTGEASVSPLAANAQGSTVAMARTVIPIKKGHGKPPLFLVHDGLGETLLYRTLAYKLDAGHPVYGLQPETRDDGRYVHTRIRDMAAAHLAQMQSVQPEGPYLLAGLCAGGVIAQEMAMQLHAQGQRTAFLGILDAADVEAAESNYESRSRVARILGTMKGDPSLPWVQRVIKVLPMMLMKGGHYVSYKIQHALERRRVKNSVEALRHQGQVDQNVGDATALTFLNMYQQAHVQHKPKGTLDANGVVVYVASVGTGPAEDVPFAEKYTDEALGWRPRFNGELTVRKVGGGHTSLLQEPNVSVLAQSLQSDINRALGQATPLAAAPAEVPMVDKAPTLARELGMTTPILEVAP